MPHAEQISFRPDEELAANLDEHAKRHGLDSPHQAAKELAAIGYREAKAPMLYRAFDLAFGAAFYLVVTSIVTVVAAYMTPVMRPAIGVRIALIMVAIAVGLLGMVELARTLNKQNALGERFETLGVL